MKNLSEVVVSIYRPATEPKGYKFAVITKNADWFDPAKPAGRLDIVGFFDDSGAILPASDELIRKAWREIRECGESADTLVKQGECDYISIGR